MSAAEQTDLLAREMTLEPEAHTYRLLRSPEASFQSCTQFVGQFFEPFVGEEIAARLVESSPRYSERTVASLLAEWKKAADDGTRVHAEIERAIETGEAPAEPRAMAALRWLERELPATQYEYFVERIVYSETLGIAGTVDLLARHRSLGEWQLVDWKTNKRINRNSYGGKRGILGPAKRLEDSHVVKYGLQLSLYRYILETHYSIIPRQQMIVHLSHGKNNEPAPHTNAEPIPLPYSKSQLQEMLAFAVRPQEHPESCP